MRTRVNVIRNAADRIICVRASASTECEPDVARLFVSFSGEGKSQEECQGKFEKNLVIARNAIANAGADPAMLRTGNLEISPGFRYVYEKIDGDRYRVFSEALYARNRLSDGYEYSSNALLELDFDGCTEEVERLWRALAYCGADMELCVSFALKDEEAVRDTLVAPAVEQARKRAGLYAKACGCKLGDVVHIEADGGNREVYRCSGARDEPECGLVPLFAPEPIEVSCEAEIEWMLE